MHAKPVIGSVMIYHKSRPVQEQDTERLHIRPDKVTSLHSQPLCFASLQSRKEGCIFKSSHSGSHFQKFMVSEAPAPCCHVKEKTEPQEKSLMRPETLVTNPQPQPGSGCTVTD